MFYSELKYYLFTRRHYTLKFYTIRLLISERHFKGTLRNNNNLLIIIIHHEKSF